jgi:hypothetical protein
MRSAAFIALIFTKLKIAERHYLGILHTKFYINLSINMARTYKNASKSVSKVRLNVTELIFTKLMLVQQLFVK